MLAATLNQRQEAFQYFLQNKDCAVVTFVLLNIDCPTPRRSHAFAGENAGHPHRTIHSRAHRAAPNVVDLRRHLAGGEEAESAAARLLAAVRLAAVAPESAPAELAPFLAPRGSVALDGVSLTVTEVADDPDGHAVRVVEPR